MSGRFTVLERPVELLQTQVPKLARFLVLADDAGAVFPDPLGQACTPDPSHVWSWSHWRRRRQYQARACHYRRRGYALT